MGVTITNLGFGDFTPGSQVARSIIALLSLLGIVQTALIVGVLSDILIIPPGKNFHQNLECLASEISDQAYTMSKKQREFGLIKNMQKANALSIP